MEETSPSSPVVPSLNPSSATVATTTISFSFQSHVTPRSDYVSSPSLVAMTTSSESALSYASPMTSEPSLSLGKSSVQPPSHVFGTTFSDHFLFTFTKSISSPPSVTTKSTCSFPKHIAKPTTPYQPKSLTPFSFSQADDVSCTPFCCNYFGFGKGGAVHSGSGSRICRKSFDSSGLSSEGCSSPPALGSTSGETGSTSASTVAAIFSIKSAGTCDGLLNLSRSTSQSELNEQPQVVPFSSTFQIMPSSTLTGSLKTTLCSLDGPSTKPATNLFGTPSTLKTRNNFIRKFGTSSMLVSSSSMTALPSTQSSVFSFRTIASVSILDKSALKAPTFIFTCGATVTSTTTTITPSTNSSQPLSLGMPVTTMRVPVPTATPGQARKTFGSSCMITTHSVAVSTGPSFMTQTTSSEGPTIIPPISSVPLFPSGSVSISNRQLVSHHSLPVEPALQTSVSLTVIATSPCNDIPNQAGPRTMLMPMPQPAASFVSSAATKDFEEQLESSLKISIDEEVDTQQVQEVCDSDSDESCLSDYNSKKARWKEESTKLKAENDQLTRALRELRTENEILKNKNESLEQELSKEVMNNRLLLQEKFKIEKKVDQIKYMKISVKEIELHVESLKKMISEI